MITMVPRLLTSYGKAIMFWIVSGGTLSTALLEIVLRPDSRSEFAHCV